MKLFRKNIRTLSVLALVVMVLGVITWQIATKDSGIPDQTEAQRDLSSNGGSPYTDLEGNVVLLSDFLGKVIVVNSWASWSPASVNELKTLSEISERYQNSEIKILAINRSEPASTAKRFLKRYNINNGIMLVLDPDDRYYESISGYDMPETVIYDKSGRIHHHERGTISASKIKTRIDEVI